MRTRTIGTGAMGVYSLKFRFPELPPPLEVVEARLAALFGEPFPLLGYKCEGTSVDILCFIEPIAPSYLLRVLRDLGGTSRQSPPEELPDFVETPWPAIPHAEQERILAELPAELRAMHKFQNPTGR